MRHWNGKRYWIVGASEGLGRALSWEMSRAGASLVLSARAPKRLHDLASQLPGPVEVAPMDISDDESVRQTFSRLGDVDGVVCLAGVYWPMSAQNWDYDRAVAMADVNFTGVIRVMGICLPQMVERGSGHVVVIGSLSGFRGLPGAIGYAASKAGVMALAEGMRIDLQGTGVEVQLVNPGFIRTRLTAKNRFRMPFILEPGAAARAVFRHMNTRRFQRSFPLRLSIPFRLSRFVPDWLWYRLFA